MVSHLIPEIHVHLMAAIPNGLTVEYMPWTLQLFEETPKIEDGQLVVPAEARPRPELRPGRDQALPGQADRRKYADLGIEACSKIYRRLGVRPSSTAQGPTTRYGGSRMRPEAFEAMREASQALVNIDELNAAAGAAIARMLGAEAALVTAGTQLGPVLQARRLHHRRRPAKIARLPDIAGMRHEFVIQRAHRFSYDQAYRVAGGVLVEIGLGRRTRRSSSRTRSPSGRPASSYLVSPFTSPPGMLAFEGGLPDRAPPRRAGPRRRRVDDAAAREPVPSSYAGAPIWSSSAAARASAGRRAPASWPDGGSIRAAR